MNYLQSYYRIEIIRGKSNLGQYHLHPQYSSCPIDELPITNVYNPEEIVKRIRSHDDDKEEMPSSSVSQHELNTSLNTEGSTHQFSQKERAQRLLDSKKISFDPILYTFTIVGESNVPHVVQLFPVESCSCPASPSCYHIMASKMSIGMNVNVDKKRINLSQLRRNVRQRNEKKSGRKKPRIKDCDVEAAPDATCDSLKPSFRDKDSDILSCDDNAGMSVYN